MTAKTKALVALGTILVAALVAVQLLDEQGAAGERFDSSSTVEEESTVDSGAEAAQPTGVPARSDGAGRTAPATVIPTQVADGHCGVTARVIGPDGEPLEGVTCRIGARRRWAKDSTAMSFPTFGEKHAEGYVGFETKTDSNGHFFLEAVVPTASRVELFLDAGPYFSQVSIRFGGGQRMEAPLSRGIRNLGEYQLAACGAISGETTSDSGAGVEDAKIILRLLDGEETARSIGVQADGTFRVANLEPGEWRLRGTAPGKIDSESQDVLVEAGLEASGLRVELLSAPLVRGRVVTVDQEPIPRATVLATSLPRSAPRKSSKSRADDSGRFELVLPTRGEFAITGQHPEFRSSAKPLRLTGSHDGVSVVLKPLTCVHVRVVDGETGEALGAFGVQKLDDGGSKAPWPEFRQRKAPKVKKVAAGYVEVFGLAGRDLLVVAAEGYPVHYADLAGATWDDGISRPRVSSTIPLAPGAEAVQQTIELARGAVVQGRVVMDGDGVAAEVAVSRATDKDNLFVTLQSGTSVLSVETDAETGAFSIDGLAAGNYSLVARAYGLSIGLPPIVLRLGETTDVGDLELAPAGTILGQVQAPPDMDPTNLFIEVVDLEGVGTAKVKADGSFRMEGVPSGLRTIRQGALRQEIIYGGEVEVNVPAGGEVRVSMDLTTFGLVRIQFQVEINGEFVPGVEMRLVDVDYWPKRRIPDLVEKYEAYLGKTRGEGLISGHGRVRGTRMPVIMVDDWSVIAHPTVRFDMSLGQPIDERVAFETSSATVFLPEGTQLPKNGSLRISLHSKEDERVHSSVTIGFEDGGIDDGYGIQHNADTGGWFLRHVAPGAWNVTAAVYEERIAPSRIGQGDLTFGTADEPSGVFRASAVLAPGGTAKIRLE